MQELELPSIGETVVCRITKVLNYGVFAELLEYENIKGFVHISQVASGWIKNIRNFVKEGQVRAAKVTAILHEKNQIDLSFTKVSALEQRKRIEEWKQLKRAKKLIEMLGKGRHKTFDDAWNAVAEPLLNEYDTLHEAFQEIALHGEGAAKGIDKQWAAPLVELVKKNIPVPEKTVKGILSLQSYAPNGVQVIQQALQKGIEQGKDAKLNVYYSGSGHYVIEATSFDFKAAERVINNVAQNVVDCLKASHGTAKFERGSQ